MRHPGQASLPSQGRGDNTVHNNMKLLSTCSVAFLLLWNGFVLAGTDPSSRRMVDGMTVDLAPLINWEKKPRGERPLASWIHLKGAIEATNGLGWVVLANVDGKKGKDRKIILKNPPQDEAAQHAQLKSELAELNREKARLESRASQPLHDRTVRTQHGTKVVHDPRRAEVADARSGLADINKRIKETQKQLDQLPGGPGKFAVDCLALKTGTVFNGLSVYNHGIVLK